MNAQFSEIKFGAVTGTALVGENISIPTLEFFKRILKERLVDVVGYDLITGETVSLRPLQLHSILLRNPDPYALVVINGEEKILFYPNEYEVYTVTESDSLRIAKINIVDVFANAEKKGVEALAEFLEEDEE
jgi:hypothetical protein